MLGDGGLTVLGINVLNIAVVPALAVHACRLAFGESARGRMAAAFVGTVLGNTLAALALARVLVVGAGADAAWTYGLLGGVQTLAGCAEGVLTALAVRWLDGRAPALLAGEARRENAPAPSALRPAVTILALATVVAALLPLASSAPDALERAAADALGETRAAPAAAYEASNPAASSAGAKP
jgi:cobalt/nickel transport system permease protein